MRHVPKCENLQDRHCCTRVRYLDCSATRTQVRQRISKADTVALQYATWTVVRHELKCDKETQHIQYVDKSPDSSPSSIDSTSRSSGRKGERWCVFRPRYVRNSQQRTPSSSLGSSGPGRLHSADQGSLVVT